MIDKLYPVVVSRKWQLALGCSAVEVTATYERLPLPCECGMLLEVLSNPRTEFREVWPLHIASSENGYVIIVHDHPGAECDIRPERRLLALGSNLLVSLPQFPAYHIVARARYVLFSAGLGIAPTIAIAKRLAAQRSLFEFHYFARSLEHALYLENMEVFGPSGRAFLRLGMNV